MEKLIHRSLESIVLRELQDTPSVALLGPRQIGKTTLARQVIKSVNKEAVFLDLEDEGDMIKLDQPGLYFSQREDRLIVIDEVQRKPELFPALRAAIDRHRVPARFLLLGSASPGLLAKSSETLAGRIAFTELFPFTWPEIQEKGAVSERWLKGGFPEIFLTEDPSRSFQKRKQLIRTYVERELPLLGLRVMPRTLRNLFSMLGHLHGQVLNYSTLSRSLGLSVGTVRRYVQYFEDAFLIRTLQPYFLNIKKRLVKAPKVYISDSGLLHALLGIENLEELEGYPGKGNSWEGFVIGQIIGCLGAAVAPFFYRTHDGSEIDLVLVKGIKPVLGIEIKYANAPPITRGTTLAARDLGGLPVLVVTPSAVEDYQHSELVTVTAFSRIFTHLEQRGLLDT